VAAFVIVFSALAFATGFSVAAFVIGFSLAPLSVVDCDLRLLRFAAAFSSTEGLADENIVSSMFPPPEDPGAAAENMELKKAAGSKAELDAACADGGIELLFRSTDFLLLLLLETLFASASDDRRLDAGHESGKFVVGFASGEACASLSNEGRDLERFCRDWLSPSNGFGRGGDFEDAPAPEAAAGLKGEASLHVGCFTGGGGGGAGGLLGAVFGGDSGSKGFGRAAGVCGVCGVCERAAP
jgi:hypothetical protein